MLTRAADYAVRVMIHLASLPVGSRVQRSALAEAAQVPDSFMSKVLQSLVRARLVSSRRGADGGFEMAREAEEITLLQIVEAIDGPFELNVCVGSKLSCDRPDWCGAHLVWLDAQEAVREKLQAATVASMAQESAKRLKSPAEPVSRDGRSRPLAAGTRKP